MKVKTGVPNLGNDAICSSDWLISVTAQTMATEPFPVMKVLQQSLYYPASGIDGGPVKYLGRWFSSFIYADYGYGRQMFLDELAARPFLGYRAIGMRSVEKNELAPNGWLEPLLTNAEIQQATRYMKERGEKPFCEWVIFERDASAPPSHGPERFSLLYLNADGAAAYKALYVGNAMRAKAIAVIQPGHAFGGNWTDFTDPQAILARVVLSNPVGMPEFFISGGFGRLKYLPTPWPSYPSLLGRYSYGGMGSVGVWGLEK